MIYGICFASPENIEKVKILLEKMEINSGYLIHGIRLSAFFKTKQEAEKLAKILGEGKSLAYSTFEIDPSVLARLKQNFISDTFIKKNKPSIYLKLVMNKVYDSAEEYLLKTKETYEK